MMCLCRVSYCTKGPTRNFMGLDIVDSMLVLITSYDILWSVFPSTVSCALASKAIRSKINR